MTAQRIQSRDGVFCVDWNGIHSMLRSWAAAVSTLENAEEKTETHWVGPDIHTVEVNWDQVRRDTNTISEAEYRDYVRSAPIAMKPILADLASKVEEAAKARRDLAEMLRAAQRSTARNVEQSVSRGETGIEVATEVRNLSAEFLMVGAGALTGGAATVALAGAGGAALKGFGTYQDAGYTHGGHAAAVFGAELVTTFVPIGKAKLLKGVKDEGMKLFMEFCFVKLEAGLDGAKAAWVEGKNAEAALLDGTNSFMTSTYGTIAEAALPEKYRKWVMPTQFAVKQAISHALDKMEKSKAGSGEGREGGPAILHRPVSKEHALMDFAVFDNCHIRSMCVREVR